MAGRDRIGELPADILDHILGFLPIEEAARTAVLSTIWRDIWSSLTQLNFGYKFFYRFQKSYPDRYIWPSAGLYAISKVLLQHNGPIRKFVFEFFDVGRRTVRSRSFDFDQWLILVTQNGVEEIHLGFDSNAYRLPNCIFSCLTLKRLHLFGVIFKPRSAPCILPNVTSLCFENVDFGGRNLLNYVPEVPMLENLSFSECENTFHFNITAPKLCSFSITCREGHDYELHAFLPVNLDLRSVCTIELNCSLEYFVKEVTRMGGLQPPVLNVEYLKLSTCCFPDDDACSAFIDLLQLCPKLRKLDVLFWCNDVENILEFVKELHSVAQTHKMFRTLKLVSFNGWKSEMLFIKGILACFPALEKVVIICPKGNLYNEFEIMQELLCFPRASAKAKIVYVKKSLIF